MTDDELTIARIEDRMAQCRDGYYITHTGLLDSHEQALAKSAAMHAGDIRTLMYGGYDGAERRMMVCIPADFDISYEEATEGLLKVIRVTKPAVSKELTHRDYLGSILGLGIERRLIGDILVRDDGADSFILPDIADFLMQEYHQAGRVEVKTEIVEASDAIIPEAKVQLIRDSVSSLRIDSIVSSAFRLARGKAAEAIRKGIVSVDHIECLKPDMRLTEGAVIVLKGKGKATLSEVGEESRKGRIRITIKRYV